MNLKNSHLIVKLRFTIKQKYLSILKVLRYYRQKIEIKYIPQSISAIYDRKKYINKNYDQIQDDIFKNISCLYNNTAAVKIIKKLESHAPDSNKKIVQEADKITKHVIYIFGKEYHLEKDLDWHKDSISGKKWPVEFHFDLRIINNEDASDIKFPWELNRLHQTAILGKAYVITKNEKYVDEFINQVYSWINANPYNMGINWSCSMEVAIRAINLIWAFSFFRESRRILKDFNIVFQNLMYFHGNYIFRNLENLSIIKGNHYLANLIGLFYISSIFSCFKISKKWHEFSVKELKSELKKQICEDGTNFEGSIPYHGLVTEMLILIAHLIVTIDKTNDGKHDLLPGNSFKSLVFSKLLTMLEYNLYYTKPDGEAPQIGDNDSGKILPFSDTEVRPNDHSHLLAVGGELLKRDDFKFAGYKSYETAIWMSQGIVKSPSQMVLNLGSKCFLNAGIYIIRNDKDYLIIKCGRLGTSGKGSHNHNDNLSFELCSDGITYFVDPGSYTYTRHPQMRNLFRSTKYHNTLVIDDLEQNNMAERDLFILNENSNPRIIDWSINKKTVYFCGEVKYNLFSGESMIHRRAINYYFADKVWDIKDVILGKGEHDITLNFHLMKNIDIIKNKNRLILISGDKRGIVLQSECFSNFDVVVKDGWYSPSYGTKEKTKTICAHLSVQLPYEVEYKIYRYE